MATIRCAIARYYDTFEGLVFFHSTRGMGFDTQDLGGGVYKVTHVTDELERQIRKEAKRFKFWEEEENKE